MNRRAARWLRKVLADSRLDDDAKTVARALAEHMDDAGRLDATDEEIHRWASDVRKRDQ